MRLPKLMTLALSLLALLSACSPSNINSTSGGGFVPGPTTTTSAAGILVTATPVSVPTTNASTITAYVVDNIGGPIGGAQVTFSLSNPLYASLSAATATTGACPGPTCGVATVTFTAGTVNTIVTVTAAIGSVNGSAQVTITGGGGGGSVSVAANPSSITVSSTSTITATVRDGTNALVGGATVNFTLSNTSANFSGSSTATATTGACPGATCGIATVTLTGTAASTVTVTATALGINGTANVTISPSTAIGTIIVTASPASIYTLGTSAITATLTDPGGSLWAGQTITFTLNNPAVATLSSATAVTGACPGATCGIASVNLTAGSLPTSVIVTASFTTTSTISSTATVAIAVPPPASLTVVANPSSILVLGTTTITATVYDAGGNPVPDGTQVNFVLSDSSYGTLSNATSTTANTNGTATTTFIAGNKAGGVAITAISGSVSNNTSLNIVPAATGSIEFVSASPQVIGIAEAGQAETSFVTFYVRDINGNAAADGTAVTFTMNGPGGGAYITGSVVGASVATSSSVNGNAGVTLHSGTVAGPVTIIASTYVNSGQQTTLSSAIDAVVTTIPVASVSGFPPSGTLRIDNELITYAGISGSTFTGCIRGSVSTLPASHLISTQVYGQTTISSSATQISIGGGVPSAGHWNLATSQFNLSGLLYSGLTATISGYIGDRFGNYNILTGTAVSFYTEAGAIDTQGITDSTGKTSVVIRTQAPDPADVKNIRSTPADADLADFASYYTSNEPWYLGRPLNYNPRDGWVTVLATTMGEESFLDENGDGLLTRSYSLAACPSGYTCECDNNGTPDTYAGSVTTGITCDAGGFGATSRRSEGFIDIGEPFYDKNDNSIRNDGSVPGYPFEEFIDGNGNGGYDGPNGMWDGPKCKSINTTPNPDVPCLTSKMIWKSIKLVFSGDYTFYPLPDGNNCYSTAGGCTATYASGSFAVASASIQKGSSGTFCVIIGDVNLNSLPGGTVIVASATPSKSVTPSSVTLIDGLSRGPTNFCFVVSIDATTADSSTVVSAGVQDTPLAQITVPLVPPPLVISTSSLPAGTIGAAYNATLTATGGTPPYSWAVTVGTLPAGLSLNASSGAITGTPAGPVGTSNFTVTITDSLAATASRALSITVN